MKHTLFCLLRHGETLWNRAKRIQGQAESPLTPEGQEQAKAWGRALTAWGFQRILSSDLGRAVETAELCNLSLYLPHERDPRLREQHWGRWQGCVLRELRQDDLEIMDRLERAGWEFRPPGGESRTEMYARIREALLDAATRHAGERILVVTHRGVLRTLDYGITGCDYMPGSPESTRRGRLLLVRVRGDVLEVAGRDAPLDVPYPPDQES